MDYFISGLVIWWIIVGIVGEWLLGFAFWGWNVDFGGLKYFPDSKRYGRSRKILKMGIQKPVNILAVLGYCREKSWEIRGWCNIGEVGWVLGLDVENMWGSRSYFGVLC